MMVSVRQTQGFRSDGNTGGGGGGCVYTLMSSGGGGGGGGVRSEAGLRSQELLLVLECWISHWRVMSAER